MSAIGIVVVLIAAIAAPWFDFGDIGSPRVHFADMDSINGTSGYSGAYFGWFAWVLLAVAGILAVAACFPTPSRGPLRILGALIGFGSAFATFAVLIDINQNANIDFTTLLGYTSFGPWLAMIGFLVIGCGAAANEIGA